MPVFANALHEGQRAQLDLGYLALRSAVIGFSGADLVLLCDGHVPVESLRPGHTSYVVLQIDGRAYGLKADVRRGTQGNEVVARLLDDFRLGQRRQFSRAPFRFDAGLRPVTEDGPGDWASTRTLDVSAGGVRIERTEEAAPAQQCEVRLDLGAESSLVARARLIRATDDALCLEFAQIPDAERLLLAQLTFAYHRRRASR